MRFDDVIAETPEETDQKLAALEMPDKCRRYAKDLTVFCYAKRKDD